MCNGESLIQCCSETIKKRVENTIKGGHSHEGRQFCCAQSTSLEIIGAAETLTLGRKEGREGLC